MNNKKRRNLYLLPSYILRLLALPYQSQMATQKPTLVYAKAAFSHNHHHGDTTECCHYISTGIYRCCILDFGTEILREFQNVKR